MCSADLFKRKITAAVQESFKKNDAEILNSQLMLLHESDADKRMVLEQVLRDTLSSLVNSETNVAIWESFITFSIVICRMNICIPTVPVVLLGDAFDAVTLKRCAELFGYVENNVDVWKEELFFLPCKNNMLRMCNDLLRRLSQSQDTYFCGRILLFLAKFFPFSERSGLNIVSEFNLENSTEFQADDAANTKDVSHGNDDPMEDESISDIARSKVDYNIYRKFWALQDFFRNPNQCYNKVHWKTFAAHASSVLAAFSSFKLDEPQTKRNKLTAAAATESTSLETEQQHYFAKYLTNQKLLDLQMSDSNFRRYILVQFLVTFQYLATPVKFKLDGFELKVDQLDWMKETTDTIHRLIEETPPNGTRFLVTVKHMLKREEIWNSWKNSGCPAFQKPTGEDEEGSVERKRPARQRRKKYLGDLMRDAASQGKYFMGNSELTKLWNLFPNNLDACKSKERAFLPSLESYFEESIVQCDPASGVEEQYKRVNDGNFGWRALRLLARRSPHFFTTHSNNPISKMPEYLEGMIRRIAKDLPSSSSNNEAKNEVADAEAEGGNNVNMMEQEADEDELLKNDMKDDGDDDGSTSKPKTLSAMTQEQILALAEKIAPDWKKLAAKLGFSSGDIGYFEKGNVSELEQAKSMIAIWVEDDEDASVENLVYTLEGLQMIEAASIFRMGTP